MLETFNLVDKRQVIHYKCDWTKHFIMTEHKNPAYICLNINRLNELSEDERFKLMAEILEYLNG